MAQQVYTGADTPAWAQTLVADLNAAIADLQKKITAVQVQALEARIAKIETFLAGLGYTP